MSLVEEVTFQRMDERVARFLEENFEKSSGAQTVLLLTHEKIASQLGTAREVVSRLLKEFERVGAIRLSRGQIILQDRDLLKSFSNRR
jgi:CRP/FNR family transcriptional regulator